MVDGTNANKFLYQPAPRISISGVGIAQNGPTAPNFIKWNSFALTQTAPGGVPPYLIDPLPPTSILLTNGTITIPATAFGSAPFGYYWTNNSSVIASGLTNNMAPLPASLSVSSSSLSPGQLQLVLTNAYGTNITVITLVQSHQSQSGNHSIFGGRQSIDPKLADESRLDAANPDQQSVGGHQHQLVECGQFDHN